MPIKRVEIKVYGNVQGVFFRQGTKNIADKFGLSGSVRNEADGSVIIVAEGEEDILQRLIAWSKIGTEWAEVKNVEIAWKDATGEFESFTISE